MKIAVACGGTGGHIFPGLATAEVLRERGHDVALWLSGRDIEEASLVGWDGKIVSVKACGFPSRLSWDCIPVAWTLFRCFLNCRRMMKSNMPDVILAMGSYASVGPVSAASSLGVPVVLHEANVIPGRAISFLSRFASTVAISFSDTANYLKTAKVKVTGFPVRKEIRPGCEGFLEGAFSVLIMGGSQGAHRLNEIAVGAMSLLKGRGIEVKVFHLTGRADEAMVQTAYAELGVSCKVCAFLEDINEAYSSSHLAVCRSGAASCAELAVAGVPAVFVPLPSAMHNHQLANAKSVARDGAADVMEEKDLTADKLADCLEGYSKNSGKLAVMKKEMLKLARPDSAGRLADIVESTGERHSE